MAEDQTSNETQEVLADDAAKLKETSEETAEVKETPPEEKTTEPEVDYAVKPVYQLPSCNPGAGFCVNYRLLGQWR